MYNMTRVESLYKDYIIAVINHYDKNNTLTANDIDLKDFEYLP